MAPSTRQRTLDRLHQLRPVVGGAETPAPARDLPPGVRWPALVQSLAVLRYRHRFLPWMKQRFGDVFTVRILPRGRNLVIFHRPEHVEEFFRADPDVFHAGKGNAILGPVMGQHSVLIVDGAEHRRARRLIGPAFSSRALARYRPMVAQIATEQVNSWPAETTFPSLPATNALTLEVILRVVFGVEDEAHLARLRPMITETVEIHPIIFLGWQWPWLLRFGPWRKALDNQVTLDDELYDLISRHRAAPELSERNDVAAQLLQSGIADGEGLSDDEVRDQLITLLLAGHETTATGLAWTLHELGRRPELQEQAYQAVIDGDDDYLEAIFKEILRLHPVIAMVVRHLTAPGTIGGVELPAGTNVGASIILAHMLEENFPEPEQLRPERFIDTKVSPYAWFPFGGGTRRCPGASFALMEAVEVLRALLTRYRIEAPAGPVEATKVRNISSVPARGGRIRLVAR